MTTWNQVISRLARRLSMVAGELPFDQAAAIGALLDPATGTDYRLKVDALARFFAPSGTAYGYGVPVRTPVETSDAIGAAGEICAFVPLRAEVESVELVNGAAVSAVTSGDQRSGIHVTLTVVFGATTFAQLEAALAASAGPAGAAGSLLPRSCLALRYTAPPATVIASGFATRMLYQDASSAPLAVRCTRREDGLWVPDTLDTSLETVYESPADVAVAAGVGTWVCPWVDVEPFDIVGCWLVNTGAANPLTNCTTYYAPNADGTGTFGVAGLAGNGAGIVINPGNVFYWQSGPAGATTWSGAYESRNRMRGWRTAVASVAGTTARIVLLGRRYR